MYKNKSIISIHKLIAKDKFKELNYKKEDHLIVRSRFIKDYFNKRTVKEQLK